MSRTFQINKELEEFCKNIPMGVTPGFQLQVYEKGQRVIYYNYAQTFSYYDLASLTKPIFTSMAYALAVDQGKVDLNSPVFFYVPLFKHRTLTINQLLTHTSGLVNYSEFYKNKSLMELDNNKKWEQLLFLINGLPLLKSAGKKSVYSDVGYLVLGMALEKIFNESLISVWKIVQDYFYPHIQGLHFNVDNISKYESSQYAPTVRCLWREKLIQGEVHDENAWALGGVSSHAGLFGSVDDAAWAALVFRSQLLGHGKKLLKQKTTDVFFKRAVSHEAGDWAMGFMMPTAHASSSGQYFSSQSIGHLGFTGTSFWFDPNSDLLVVLLSNRVFYGRNNMEFNQIRPLLHDHIVRILKKY